MGRDINLVRTGPRGGAPVVLLHSAGLDLTYWDHQIAALGRRYDVVAVDLPGHGRTPGVAQDWTLEAATAFVGEVVDRVCGGPAHLVGLSLGGTLSQAFVLARPDRVASLSLIDIAPTFTPAIRASMRSRAATAREQGMRAVLEGLFEHWFTPATRAARPDLVERATTTLLDDDPLVHAAMWEMLAAFEVTDRLARISCPTQVIVGEHDSSSPVSSALLLRDSIRGARLRVVPEAAHLTPLEAPHEVNRHLSDFLDAVA
jgi:3-oxoadipate enol-lactonase